MRLKEHSQILQKGKKRSHVLLALFLICTIEHGDLPSLLYPNHPYIIYAVKSIAPELSRTTGRGKMMICIGVCDDEIYMLNMLTERISLFFKNENMEVTIFSFQSGKELLASDQKLDILFLDIQMGEPDGFDTAKELRSRGFSGSLIFVTVLQDDVFNAFEVQAFDYLVKPLQEDLFIRTMDRLLQSLRNHSGKQLLIQKGTEWNIVPFDDIVYCEIINRKVYLHLKDALVLDYYEKIENLEKKLDEHFFKCHRSYLINLQYLKSYKAGLAYLINGETIPVSRLRGEGFSAAILQYMKERRYGK